MRLVIESIITVAVIFALLKLGWPAPVFLVPLYLLAFSLGLLSLSKRVKVSSRFLAFLAVFLTVGAVVGWITAEALFLPEIQTDVIAKSRLLTFLVDSNTLRVFWSVVIGLIVPALLTVIFLIPYGFTVGQSLYSQYEQYKGHEGEAAFSAISILLGINRGTWIVSDGKAEARGEAGGALARFGGPGVLIVQEGHAVILEKSGKLSRVVGRGITWLEPFERISMVVPLNGRAERVVVEQVATKDKVLLEEIAVLVFHKIDPGPQDERVQDGQFAYTEQKLFADVWSPSGGDWRNTVKSISDGAVRDIVGRYDLEELMPMSDRFRERFKNELQQTINTTTSKSLGVETIAVDIGQIKIPEEARKRLLEKWLADWSVRVAQSEREAMIRKGEAEAVILKLKEVAWAQAQKQLVEQMAASFRNLNLSGRDTAAYLLSLRFLETLEKMANDPATKILLPSDSLALIQRTKDSILSNTIGPALPGS